MKKQIFLFTVLILITIAITLVISNVMSNNYSEIVTSILNSIIAIIGLLLAFTSTVLTYWTRSDAHRHTLYEKQLIAYEYIYYKLLSISRELTLNYIIGETSEDKIAIVKKYKQDIWEITREHWVIYPLSIKEIIVKLSDGMDKLADQIVAKKTDDDKQWELLRIHYNNLVDLQEAIRLALGIEIVNKSNIELLGLSSEYNKLFEKKTTAAQHAASADLAKAQSENDGKQL